MANLDEKISTLEEKLKQAKALKQQREARVRSAEAKKQRTLENRKKILIGAAILAMVKTGEWSDAKIAKMMDVFLTKDNDRKVFDLPPKVQG